MGSVTSYSGTLLDERPENRLPDRKTWHAMPTFVVCCGKSSGRSHATVVEGLLDECFATGAAPTVTTFSLRSDVLVSDREASAVFLASVQFDRLDDANFAASPDLMFWFLIFHSYLLLCPKKGIIPPTSLTCHAFIAYVTNEHYAYQALERFSLAMFQFNVTKLGAITISFHCLDESLEHNCGTY
ncbi:hypothetical protein CLF_108920 [Clonorchis sinensis]|uniref:Uncharacterized protein n=1 Tax=Clonorchis sinensis TaxID=79923 RepID=G7YS14_CLOSI|nr:hypothetical protein CLF_108920 [Clonorchis sinensis]